MVESIEAQVHKKATCSEKAHLMDNVHNQVRVMEITVRVCIRMVSSIKVNPMLIVTTRLAVKGLNMAD